MLLINSEYSAMATSLPIDIHSIIINLRIHVYYSHRKSNSKTMCNANFAPQVEPETVNNEFHVALYFVVVSITTLGYGDMAPKSAWGRFFVVIMVLSSVVLVPLQASLSLE